MFRFTAVFVLLFFTAIAPVALAGKVATWRHDKKADFEKGELDGVVIGRDGRIELARKIQEVCDLDCGSIWDLIRTDDGHLLAATALPGKVVRISADGQTETLWNSEKQQAFALATAADGAVLVGTGPTGAIHRIPSEGETSTLFESEELYIWDLLVDAEGNVYAATGPGGKIYKIKPDGQADVFYETRQEHVLTLAWAADGSLLAGTDGAGLVLSIDPSGKGRVLYDTAEDEVRSLWVAADGVVYAGTAAGASTRPAASRSGTTKVTPTESGTSSDRSTPTSSSKTKKGANSVYRIDSSGGVRKVLTASALVYDLACIGSGADRCVVAGTGTQGLLYTLDEDGNGERQLARLDAESLLSLIHDEEGRLWLGTGNPGKVFSLSSGYRDSGTLTSPALDAALVARFGKVDWRAGVPEGTQVSLAVRSGNTQKPDETWSEWSVDETDPTSAAAQCPAGRFLQYRVTLRTQDSLLTPTVRSVAVRYLTANQQPQFTKLTVPHVEEGDGKTPLEKLKITWAAKDPNKDELVYRLSFRKDDWKNWITAKDELTAVEYEWDTTSVPEGVYLVRVEASDRRSNPPDVALDATRVSEPFIVDAAAPQVVAKLVAADAAQKATFHVELDDTMTPLARASYSLDSGPWKNIFPEDGLLDSTRESIRFELESLTPGTHVVVVRATDTAGHTGSTDVVFEIGLPQAASNEPAVLVEP